MAVPTNTENKKIDAHRILPGRSAAAANNADGVINVIESDDVVAESSTAESINKRFNEYVTTIAPNDTMLPNSAVGDRAKAYLVDSDEGSNPWNAEHYLKTAYGWEKVATQLVADVTLTTEQVLALHATPITCIAAPGAGKIIVVDSVLGMLDFDSVAYDGIAAGEDLALKYTDDSGATIATLETTGWLDQGEDALQYATPAASVKPVANAPIVANLLTDEIASGDSPVKLRIWYRVLPSAL